MPDLDPVLTLAHTLHATSSPHAFLLGAGVSIASGVPSAWGVVEALIQQIAVADGQNCGENAAEWFNNRYEVEPEYEAVLEAVAPRPIERQRLLRRFFESAEGDIQRTPSLAHRSLARLVRSGRVNVIVTLNFDRLTETALREAGVEPTVVTSVADIAGLAPLHTIEALVVHLHGDYLSAHTMLNTKSELAGYTAEVNAFLDKVLSSYGLVVVGWSATYDPALREAISRQPSHQFTPYWIEPGVQSQMAVDLLVRRSMVKVDATADEALGRLADAVQALQDRRARHHLTLPTAVATAKRELRGAVTAVKLHDLLQAEFNRLRQLPELTRTEFTELPAGGLVEVLGRLDEAATTPVALAATIVYWGPEDAQQWWMPEIERFAQYPRGASGSTALIKAQNIPAVHLLWITGVAAVAAGRDDLLLDLLHRPHLTDGNERREPVASGLTPGNLYQPVGEPSPSHRLFELYLPTFTEHLAISRRAYEEAWETFEILRMVEILHNQADAQHLVSIIDSAARLAETQRDVEEAQGQSDPDVLEAAEDKLRQTRQAHESVFSAYEQQVWVSNPHVRVAADFRLHSHPPVVGSSIYAEVRRERGNHHLVRSGFCSGDPDALTIALAAVAHAVGHRGRDAAWASQAGRMGIAPDYYWLDTMERPTY